MGLLFNLAIFVALGVGVFTLAARISDNVFHGTRTERPARNRHVAPPVSPAETSKPSGPVFLPVSEGSGSREAYARMRGTMRRMPPS